MKKQKPAYLIVLMILGIVILAIGFVLFIVDSLDLLSISDNVQNETNYNNTTTTKKIEINEDEYKNKSKVISYKDLSRNPQDYTNEIIKIEGQVLQVLESYDKVTLRVATKKLEYLNNYYDDVILIEFYDYDNNNNRILEDDFITIWGMYKGITKYTTVMGGQMSIPWMYGTFYEIK